jgi:PD-(D/E)XK endonuclease
VGERLINRGQQGDLGEASAIDWLTGAGAIVLLPVGHSPDFDLVAALGDELLRVQVKTSLSRTKTPNGEGRHVVRVATSGGNQSWTGTVKRFDPQRADYLFVLLGDGRRWFIPTPALEAATAIQLGGAKYSEYEISRASPIEDLVYGRVNADTRIRPRFGGVPKWSNGMRCKRIGSAFTGSNPVSPTIRVRQATIWGKRRITLPLGPFEEAQLSLGDRLHVRSDGSGRLVLERVRSPTDPSD